MKVVESFPHEVREIENVWIRMSDGCRLAARLWLPESATARPVPAILEYIPYGKRDGTRLRDEPMHRWFAGHGYASVRVDLRGAGDSEGLLQDEYLEVELTDGMEVLHWIATQPWCSGRVGMIGKSWGGFNALQIASRRPPSLGAIITVCAADDRYGDDAHYMGGCLLNENLIWGAGLFTLAATPPDPQLMGDEWSVIWNERLQSMPLFPERWLRHPWRDAYWQHGSVIESYDRIACPVYAVGGWADGYTNAVPRLLAGLRCPRKGLVGPWGHQYPHEGVPGPAIGFLQEALRWWDHWLRGQDTGIMDEPMYRVWMQDSFPPATYYATRPGRWVAEKEWPSPRLRRARWKLGPGELAPPDTPLPPGLPPIVHRSPQSVGLASGAWCAFGVDGELPGDQREDDGKSMVFDTDPLEEPLEILGAPIVHLELEVDRPVAFVVARLNDVAPDGASARVSYGVINLTHRESHSTPSALVPGKRYAIDLRLNEIGQAIPRDHRLRLAISTTYWPMIWPSPETVTLKVIPGKSRLELPVRPPSPGDKELFLFGEPEGAPPPAVVELEPGGVVRRVQRDLGRGSLLYEVIQNVGGPDGVAREYFEAIDLEVGESIVERYRLDEHDPLSATAVIEHRFIVARGDHRIRVETGVRLSADRDHFHIQGEVRAHRGDELHWTRTWDHAVPRRLL